MISSASALSRSCRDAVSKGCGRARSYRPRLSSPAAMLRSSLSSSAAAAFGGGGGIVAVAGGRHQHRNRQSSSSSSSSPPAAFAAAAAALVAAAFSDGRGPAEAEAAAVRHPGPEADLRALGKSLQQSHERQMVKMAKLLHSLETLAEEAEREKQQEQQSEREEGDGANDAIDNVAATATVQEEEEDVQRGHADMIHVTDAELADLSSSPEKVWEHIEALKNGAIYGPEDVKRIARAACAAMLKEPSLIDLSERCKSGGDLRMVSAVGDLHGHFRCSFLKVLDMLGGEEERRDGISVGGDGGNDGGSPWDGSGAVVFNGDFVDRGPNSLEVLVALLLLKLAYPNNVYLNRGNHEDTVIAEVYGCSDEIHARYGDAIGDRGVKDIWKDFGDVFASLPLAVLTDTAIIMHGGLPSADFRLEQIARISPEDRFRIKTMVEPAANDETCRLVQNVMWSDPHPEPGLSPNEDRGCGMKFGPDVVRSFLTDHGLKYLVRSHEPVDEGYELLECDEHGMSAVTVFSAASYPDGAGFNHGAVMRLRGGNATFDAYREGDGLDEDGAGAGRTMQEKMKHTFKAFAEVIAANRAALEEEFEYMARKRAERRRMRRTFSLKEGPTTGSSRTVATSARTSPAAAPDVDDDACITPEQWADAMNFVLDAELPGVDWLGIQRFIAPGELIHYKRFLNLQCSLSSYDREQAKGMDDKTRNTIMRNHEAIFKVFKFLDADGSGEVDRDEFCDGIAELKARNPDAAVSFDAETLFDSIDADGSGTIELSEFQQAFQAADVPYHVAVMMLLDTDNSGTIDRIEFREGVRLLNARLGESERLPESEDEIDALFDELDDDDSGELDVEEFEAFMCKYYPH